MSCSSALREFSLPGVKHILGVASGKGGVGKSTVAFHLSLALSAQGKRVGLLDADLHGPSLPFLIGRSEKPDSQDGKRLEPVLSHGIATMSMGFLVAEGKAAVWRGPMMHHALQQLTFQVNWPELDFLIIDFPPGTGDIPLSLAQKLVLDVVLVSTSQRLAVEDMKRGAEMFSKMNVPIKGLIENMAFLPCASCGYENHLWGSSSLQQEAEKMGVPFLGALPLDPQYQAIWPEGQRSTPEYQKLVTKILKTYF